MKMNFKHINGMMEARKKGAFMSELECYDTHKVEKLVQKKIIKPATNVIECSREVVQLVKINDDIDRFLKNFNKPVKKVVVKKEPGEKRAPIRFMPNLDMGNIYQISKPKLGDPVLQGGLRHFG